MKKLAILVLMLFCLVTAVSAATINPEITPSSTTVDPGTTITYTLNLNYAAETGDTATPALVGITGILRHTNGINTIPADLRLAFGDTLTFQLSVPANQLNGVYMGALGIVILNSTSQEIVSGTAPITLTVNPKPSLSIDTTKISVEGKSGETITSTFKVENTGNTLLSNILLNHDIPLTRLEDRSDDKITLSFSSQTFNLNPDQEQTITLTIAIEDGFDPREINGKINATTTYNSASVLAETALEIFVSPNACEFDSEDKLEISVSEPGTNDEWEGGNTYTLDVYVEYDESDDMDINVYVDAYLVNIDDGRVEEHVKSSKKEIDGGEEENFKIDLTVPSSVDENNDYILYIKAYGRDDNNLMQCSQTRIPLDVKGDLHQVEIKEARVTPFVVRAGGYAEILVRVENVGEELVEDVKISIISGSLNLLHTSNLFDLSKDEDDEEHTHNEIFSLQLPKNIKEGAYQIKVEVEFEDGETVSEFVTLNVEGEEKKEEETPRVIEEEEEEPTPTSPVTGAVTTSTFATKGLWDKFSQNELPTGFWVLLNLLIAFAIILIAAFGFRRK